MHIIKKIKKLKIVKKIFAKLCSIKNIYDINPHISSYSQAGEDRVLYFLLRDKGVNIKEISYLDIGTNYPDECNNTYLFYKIGARGVCVEADESLIPTIKKCRPQDKIINAGVSTENSTTADFYIFDISGHNTFDKLEADKKATYNKIVKVAKVPLININELMATNFKKHPDLLSIDIEGLDLDVLKSLDYSKYPIPIICVETCEFSMTHIRPKTNDIKDYMVTQNYEVYSDTYINTIFVNKNWFYQS